MHSRPGGAMRVRSGLHSRPGGAVRGRSGFHGGADGRGTGARAARPYLACRRRSELRTTNTDEQAIAALASIGESRPAIASGTIATL